MVPSGRRSNCFPHQTKLSRLTSWSLTPCPLPSAATQLLCLRRVAGNELGLVFVPQEPRGLVQSRPLPSTSLQGSCQAQPPLLRSVRESKNSFEDSGQTSLQQRNRWGDLAVPPHDVNFSRDKQVSCQESQSHITRKKAPGLSFPGGHR